MQGTGTTRSYRAFGSLAGLALALLLPVTQAAAFDPGKGQKSDDPWAAFRFGFDAYRSGDKKEAIEAYRYAADKGHAGAQWKLARMYADGDGVSRNEYEAFKIFRNIVRMGAEPGSPNESYVSDALVALAGYVRKGIPMSPVRADPRLARDLYLQAASMFGNPDAQFEMGRMLLEGDGGREALGEILGGGSAATVGADRQPEAEVARCGDALPGRSVEVAGLKAVHHHHHWAEAHHITQQIEQPGEVGRGKAPTEAGVDHPMTLDGEPRCGRVRDPGAAGDLGENLVVVAADVGLGIGERDVEHVDASNQ